MGSPDVLLSVRDIHTYYGDSYVLQGLSLAVSAGAVAAILGRNGMGKTTLIRSVSGLTPPRSGSILFKGSSLERLPPYRIAQLGIALVPQGRRIFPSLNVRENLLVPTSGFAKGVRNPKEHGKRWDLKRVFEEFPALQSRAKQRGGTLSGGEQQMLAVGRALMANPDLILMDEPSEGLAPFILRQIGEIMKSIRQDGHSILLVEQNFRLAMDVADDVYVMTSGQMAYHGLPKDLEGKKDILLGHLGI